LQPGSDFPEDSLEIPFSRRHSRLDDELAELADELQGMRRVPSVPPLEQLGMLVL